jgi:hypothetical protein
MLERQTIALELGFEILEEFVCRTIRRCAGRALAYDFDELSTQPAEQYGFHGADHSVIRVQTKRCFSSIAVMSTRAKEKLMLRL